MTPQSNAQPKTLEPGLNGLWKLRKSIFENNQVLDQQTAQKSAAQALDYGEAFLAYDFAAAGLQQGANPRLLQQQALALARTGSTQRAQSILQQMRDQGHLDEETLGILARTYKDLWLSETDSKNRASFLQSSLALYREAYERNRGYWWGINVASLSWIAGEHEQARSVARKIKEELQQNTSPSEDRLWREATVA